MQGPEEIVKAQIVSYLALRGVLAFRMNAGAKFSGGRMIRFGVKGMADFLAMKDGLCYWIEIKKPTKKGAASLRSAAQEVFEQVVVAAGCRYILADKLEDVIAVFG